MQDEKLYALELYERYVLGENCKWTLQCKYGLEFLYMSNWI